MVAKNWWRVFFSGVVIDFWLTVPTADETRAEVDFLEKMLRLPSQARVLDVCC